jgi:hypothetical protein
MNAMTYQMIGADGREYGPVTPDQMRQWIGEGRANGRTRVRSGQGEWKTLGDCSEFAELLAIKSAETAVPPRINRLEAERMASDVVARGRQVEVAECFSRGWATFTSHFWLAMGATALILLISFGLAALSSSFAALPFLFLCGPLIGGLAWFFLRLVRGEAATVADVFVGFSKSFVPLMLAGLVSSVLVTVGFAFCAVPGIYLATAWVFAFLLVLDKRLDFWPALELSRRVVTARFWPIFGLLFLCGLLTFAGALLFGLGVFFTTPLVVSSIVWAYEELFREPTAAASAPSVPLSPVAPPAPAAPVTPPPESAIAPFSSPTAEAVSNPPSAAATVEPTVVPTDPVDVVPAAEPAAPSPSPTEPPR